MKGLLLKPSMNYSEPQLETIELSGELKDLQKAVGGYIEGVYDLDQYNISMFCNDEGKMLPLEPCLWIYDKQDIIFGNVIFIGVDSEGADVELTDEQIKTVNDYVYKNIFTFEDLFKILYKV